MSTAQVLSSADALLATHQSLLNHVRTTQTQNRNALRTYLASQPSSSSSDPESPSDLRRLLDLPLGPSPSAGPFSLPDDRGYDAKADTDDCEDEDITAMIASVVRPEGRVVRPDLPPAKKARCARYENYIPEEETIRNDYCQRYVDGGEWPQNWVVGAEMERRFEEYPKQQRLLALKKAAVAQHALTPTYLTLETSRTALVGLKFDVILIDPPFSSSFTWDRLEALPVSSLAADPSFIFLWVGSGAGEGLERGREVLGKWGYRRCEDIVWVKTNKESNKGPGTNPPTTSLLTRTKQHCLMGIRGTVRRSTDNWFVHCNVDTDVIFWEGDPSDPTRKPPEMYQLIENFCLGTRRLELFGRYHSLRKGWVCVTSEELNMTKLEAREKDNAQPFVREEWERQVTELAQGGKYLVPNSAEIESLRPKSPTPRGERANTSAPSSGGSMVPSSSGSTTMNAMPMTSLLPNNPMRTVGAQSMGSAGGMNMGMGGGGPQNLPPRMMGGRGNGQPMQMMNPGMGPMNMNMAGMNTMGGMGMGNMGMVGMPGPGNMGMVGMNAMGGRNMQMGSMGRANPLALAGGNNMGGMGAMNNNQVLRRNGPGFGGSMSGSGRGGLSGGVGLGVQQATQMQPQEQDYEFDQDMWVDNSSEYVAMGGMGHQGFVGNGQGGMWMVQDAMDNMNMGGFAPMNQMGMGLNMGFGAQGMNMGHTMNQRQWRGF